MIRSLTNFVRTILHGINGDYCNKKIMCYMNIIIKSNKWIHREEEGVVCVYQSWFLLSRASATMLTFAGKMTHRLRFLPDIERRIEFSVYCILLSRLH